MGGGRKYLYPKWVWTPAGGWWHKAGPNARVYQGAWIFFTVTSSYFFYNYAERNTVCAEYSFFNFVICQMHQISQRLLSVLSLSSSLPLIYLSCVSQKYFFPKESIPRELPESMKGHGHH
jgi:hypothetical protein